MKYLYMSLLIVLLFNSFGLSQTLLNQSNRGEISSPDSIPVIYVPGIMGSPMYNDVNDDDKLIWEEKAWIGPEFFSMWLAENGIDPASSDYNIKAEFVFGNLIPHCKKNTGHVGIPG